MHQGAGTTKELTHWIRSWPTSCAAKQRHNGVDTWGEIWLYLQWSFQALFDGVHPVTDYKGRPFEPGSRRHRLAGEKWCVLEWRAFIISVLGDLDYYHKDLWMPGHRALLAEDMINMSLGIASKLFPPPEITGEHQEPREQRGRVRPHHH